MVPNQESRPNLNRYFCILLKLIKRHYFEERTFLVEARNQDIGKWRKWSRRVDYGLICYTELTLITSPLCRPAPSLGFCGTTCFCISSYRSNNCFSVSSWVFLILKVIKVPLKEGSLSDKMIHYNIPSTWLQSSPIFASTTKLYLGFATKVGCTGTPCSSSAWHPLIHPLVRFRPYLSPTFY